MENIFTPPFMLKRTEFPERYLWELIFLRNTEVGNTEAVWTLETGITVVATEVMQQFFDEMKELGNRNIWDQVRGD